MIIIPEKQYTLLLILILQIENMFPFQQKYARPCTDIMKEKLIEIIKNFARTAGSLSGRFFEMMSYDVLRKGGKFKM